MKKYVGLLIILASIIACGYAGYSIWMSIEDMNVSMRMFVVWQAIFATVVLLMMASSQKRHNQLSARSILVNFVLSRLMAQILVDAVFDGSIISYNELINKIVEDATSNLSDDMPEKIIEAAKKHAVNIMVER